MGLVNAMQGDGPQAKYYMGQKIAPILTIVIGGNHEASNYMWELYVFTLLLLFKLFFFFLYCLQNT